MRAMIIDEPGPPSVLRLVERDDPEPGPGQVVIAVEVAAVVFVDTQIRAGTSPMPLPPLPFVPGNGVGGTVDAVGEDVDRSWLGARVVTATGGTGGYASRAVTAVADLHRVPPSLDLRVATALLADGRTALGLARAAGITPTDVVAVTAAAGGVGGLIVQLAAHAGGEVVALAGDDRKLTHATKTLGARHSVNYRREAWSAALTEVVPEGLDVVFDGIGGAVTADLFRRVRPGGRYLRYGAASGAFGVVAADEAERRQVTLIGLPSIAPDPVENYRLVEDALALAGGGTLRPTIGQTFRLEDAAAAHAAIEARATIGKTLLVVDE